MDIFQCELKFDFMFNVQILKDISRYKDTLLQQIENEIKMKLEKHSNVVTEAIFPFDNVKYS